jgi:BirA family transcriptional regulator, biotin operon repressor / biotin---[acetyl-CoA-carboxylase] ligase
MMQKAAKPQRHVVKNDSLPLRASVPSSLRGSSFQLPLLRKSIKPFRLHFFTRLCSTNDHAAALRKRRKLFAPSIVLTSHQLAGRGRGSNTWWSGRGSLTVTFVLPVHDYRQPHQIPLIAGVAVRNCLALHSGIEDIQLKWPNDLLHRGRKLAGFLCERVDGVDLIGLGLNVNVDLKEVPKALRENVTSLRAISGVSFDMTALLTDLAKALHQVLSHRDEPPFAEILEQYDRHHALAGKRIRINNVPGEPPLTGTCAGLDRIGRLLVRHGSSVSQVIAGQVTQLDRR